MSAAPAPPPPPPPPPPFFFFPLQNPESFQPLSSEACVLLAASEVLTVASNTRLDAVDLDELESDVASFMGEIDVFMRYFGGRRRRHRNRRRRRRQQQQQQQQQRRPLEDYDDDDDDYDAAAAAEFGRLAPPARAPSNDRFDRFDRLIAAAFSSPPPLSRSFHVDISCFRRFWLKLSYALDLADPSAFTITSSSSSSSSLATLIDSCGEAGLALSAAASRAQMMVRRRVRVQAATRRKNSIRGMGFASRTPYRSLAAR